MHLDRARAALPDLSWEEVSPRALPRLVPPATPLGPLRRALKSARRPVLLVNDDARVLLDGLGDVLAELWEGASRPPLLVATGTHRSDPARMRDLLGGLPLELHDCDRAEDHTRLGEAAVDRRVAAADLVLAFGSVEPHYFAGWTGAHKTATIGVCDRATIERNHRHALDVRAAPLVLEGNPVFEGLAGLVAAVEQGRRLLCVNHVLDEEGRALGVAVGTWRGSLERAARVARRRFAAPIAAPADLVVAEVHGPLAESLYQADKGIKNTEACVRDGGDLVLLAPLPRGLGAARFVELLRRAPDLAAAQAQVEREGYVLGDHKAVRLRALQARGVRLHVASERLDPAALEGTGLQAYPSLDAALAAVEARRGRALWVHDAGVCVPEVRAEDTTPSD
ncbi:MAG: lactate racemase domain-containing protein [Planctomycetota bacterium]